MKPNYISPLSIIIIGYTCFSLLSTSIKFIERAQICQSDKIYGFTLCDTFKSINFKIFIYFLDTRNFHTAALQERTSQCCATKIRRHHKNILFSPFYSLSVVKKMFVFACVLRFSVGVYVLKSFMFFFFSLLSAMNFTTYTRCASRIYFFLILFSPHRKSQ